MIDASEYQLVCGPTVYEITKIEDYDPNLYYVTFNSYSGVHINKKTLLQHGLEHHDNGAYRLRKKPDHMPVDEFHIKAGRRDWDKSQWVVISKHSSIDEVKPLVAEHTAKARETDSDWSFRIAKETIMSDVPLNEEWAKFRFESGEWTPVPWEDKYPLQGAHISKEDSGYVAFWRNPEDASHERVTQMRAGAYLKEYYSEIPDQDIETWVTKMDPPGELILSGPEPEDIYNAYQRCEEESGVHSCMSYSDDSNNNDGEEWPDGNPVRVYGAGDLQIAMLIRHGKAVARALVWPDKKVYGRRYGDYKRLKDALLAAGYTEDCEDNSMHGYGGGGFTGARLLKIPYGTNNYIMPYVDHNYRVADKGDHFILSHTEGKFAQRTCGTLLEIDDELDTCPSCDDQRHLEYHVDGEDVCGSCYHSYARTCDVTGDEIMNYNSTRLEDGRLVRTSLCTWSSAHGYRLNSEIQEQAA